MQYQRAPVFRNLAIFQKYILDKSAFSFEKKSKTNKKPHTIKPVTVSEEYRGWHTNRCSSQTTACFQENTTSVSGTTEIIPSSLFYQAEDWTTNKLFKVCAPHLFISALVPSKLSDPRISSSVSRSHEPARFNNINRIIKLIQYSIIHPWYQKHNALVHSSVQASFMNVERTASLTFQVHIYSR